MVPVHLPAREALQLFGDRRAHRRQIDPQELTAVRGPQGGVHTGQYGVNSGAVDGSIPAVRVDLGLWTGTEQAAQAPVLGELLQLRALRLQLVAARDRADGLQRGGELVPGNA